MICPKCRSVAPDQAPFCPRCRTSFTATAPPIIAPGPPARPSALPWREALERRLSFGDTPWKNFAFGAAIVALFSLWAIVDIARCPDEDRSEFRPEWITGVWAEPEFEELEIVFALADDEGRPVQADGRLTVEIVALSERGWQPVYRRHRTIGRRDFEPLTIQSTRALACYVAVPYTETRELRAARRAGRVAKVRVMFAAKGCRPLSEWSDEFPLVGL